MYTTVEYAWIVGWQVSCVCSSIVFENIIIIIIMIDDILIDVCRSCWFFRTHTIPNTPRSIIFLLYYLPMTCFNAKHTDIILYSQIRRSWLRDDQHYLFG